MKLTSRPFLWLSVALLLLNGGVVNAHSKQPSLQQTAGQQQQQEQEQRFQSRLRLSNESTIRFPRGGAAASRSSSSRNMKTRITVTSTTKNFKAAVEESTKASIPSSVFNLVNNVAGAGILTLSAGMATGTGLIPSCLICILLGWMSGHTFTLIGDACELTGERDFKV